LSLYIEDIGEIGARSHLEDPAEGGVGLAVVLELDGELVPWGDIGRYRRDLGEIWGRYGRGMGEI